ncbi:MAG TPA: ABC transporter permease [Bosea sp. (in: a-proteobacteria)]|jgi:peptide/nickel transport system permease protein|uniref:ABC transporter permease n=1 Tax=Bosea sp. (in: a-proteobacteria) TaxID=1871050 RepID=UPI002E11F242|nr:ABC transporter permease [Bosea sp. (in: a-proteobacteria)]
MSIGYVAVRLLQVIPSVLGIAVLNFALLHLAPGDAAEIIAAQSGGASKEFVEELRRSFGIDLPIYQQFFVYLGKLVSFDLGISNVQQRPVLELISERMPATLLLMLTSIGIAIVVGVLCGVVAAMRHRKWVDTCVSVLALLCYATPQFWLGLMLIVLFSVTLGVLPSGGMMTIGAQMGPFERALDIGRHLVLPALTLGLFYAAVYARLMRASMLEVYSSDFITTARAKGVSEGRISMKHAARNALLPVVTLGGVQIGHMLGGSILVETVFGWPGLGRLLFDGLLQRDLNLLLGILFISSILVVVCNLLVDLVYSLLDPRILAR